jgi:hypothetical protein
MQQRLIDANFEQADEPLEETGRLLSTLADAWMAVPEPEVRCDIGAHYEEEPGLAVVA